jgi:hypothetical protein
MEENQVSVVLNIIKLPIIFVLYLFYIVFSIFIPGKYVNKVINIERIEDNLNLYFSKTIYLKVIALLITIIIYIYIYN